ncbi:hypothetical protein LTR72_005115 [Exophiala xenobiotica]|nr:hypothetical protein LTR92_001284 [Exophiala xenobiotica]KAK5223729.1 hypothetical protein LTR72_005115 [Exophiala xenobiotica]KAK5289130.1 hypothetical protein LTR14_007381 [Exophiala xenobiotica]KAK5500024.1 hypothetical protein LTR55_000847 [Exophiala xenobiotica]KAK5560183.1 hypothetical protein LTR46_001933 [Exophiala xenobiotica]
MPVHVPGMEEDTMMTNSNEGLTGPVNPLAEGDTVVLVIIRCCFPLVATEEHSKEQAVRIGDVKNIVIELIEKDDISRIDTGLVQKILSAAEPMDIP